MPNKASVARTGITVVFNFLPTERRESWTVASALFLVLVVFALQQPAMIVGCTIVCLMYVLVKARHACMNIKWAQMFFALTLLFIPAFLKPYHGLSPVYYALSTIASLATAYWIAKKRPLVLYGAIRTVYWISILLISGILYSYWGHPEPFGEVIEGSSTNGIPAYLIVVQIGLSLTTYLVRHRLPLLTPCLTFGVAFFGNGRGSIVVAILIIGGTLLLNLMPGNTSKKARFFYFVVLTSVAVILSSEGEEILDLVSSYTKLSVGLVDANRLEIWSEYSRKIDAVTLLIGADYSGTIIESTYRNNPHIAYVRTHSFFGLPITLLAMLSPLVILFGRSSVEVKIVFFYFTLLAALRAYSEPILFPTLLDIFYFMYFFIFFNYARKPALP
jgi:hypothetical protein